MPPTRNNGTRAVAPGPRKVAGHRRNKATGASISEGTVSWRGFDFMPFDVEAIVEIRGEGDQAAAVISKLVIEAKADGPAIGARSLQGARLGTVCAAAFRSLSQRVDESGRMLGLPGLGGDVASADLEWLQRPRKPRGSGARDAELERAAEAYREALSRGEPTGEAVRRALHVSPSTARKRILEARAAGFVPPPKTRTRASIADYDRWVSSR